MDLESDHSSPRNAMTLTYADRQKLHIRTIGSVNVKKRARTELGNALSGWQK
jgi:hypothetical protein